ncbi:hypothetical protein ACHAXA_009636 [Cyclostephanos tholiformis]|uniref:Transmembrane protein n=1 Tax=Cyclostephanos tholiformis TaxID=382380 RepID=A0ABD3SE78_9STRA
MKSNLLISAIISFSLLSLPYHSSGEATSVRGGGGGGLRRNPKAQLASKGRVLLTDDEIKYYKYDDDDELNADDNFEEWLAEDEGNQIKKYIPSSVSTKASDTAYIVTSKVQAWESTAESKAYAWKSTANSTAWEFYEVPPSQWTTRQWELCFDLLLGLFAVCSLCLLCCVHCCCIHDVDPEANMLAGSRKHSTRTDDDATVDINMDLGVDYEDCQRTESLVDYVSVMRERGRGLESWEEGSQSQPNDDVDESWSKNINKMRKKGWDALLEARGRHNFVGYYQK